MTNREIIQVKRKHHKEFSKRDEYQKHLTRLVSDAKIIMVNELRSRDTLLKIKNDLINFRNNL